MSVGEDPVPHDSHLILMGTGTSVGVPIVGCDCGVCKSTDPRNNRMRSGVLVRAPQGEFVIDTGPELRLQLLRSEAKMIRAALFTHAHADHIMGLDDLRIFGFRLEKEQLQIAEQQAQQDGTKFDKDECRKALNANIPLHCEEIVEEAIRNTFHYAFTDPTQHAHRFAVPRLSFSGVKPGEPLDLLGLQVTPIRLHHGKLPILGYRIGDVAFCTDVSTIPMESRELLQGLDTLIIDALRYEPHPTHLNVDQAVKWVERLKPRQAFLTHMAHDLEYHALVADLPEGIEPGYDGLVVPITSL